MQSTNQFMHSFRIFYHGQMNRFWFAVVRFASDRSNHHHARQSRALIDDLNERLIERDR
jgi:hypothetical protein